MTAVVLDLPPAERTSVIEQLREWSSGDRGSQSAHRFMTSAELLQVSKSSLIEVGAHTVNHPVLAELSRCAQNFEMERSKTELEEILGRSVRGFSYPYGSWADYSRESVRIARRLFTYACANNPGSVTTRSDRYQLPRVLVRDWGRDEFFSRLGLVSNKAKAPERVIGLDAALVGRPPSSTDRPDGDSAVSARANDVPIV